MAITINEAGALKSLNTSNYGSEMFIDDSLWQDKTLAELGFTEEMCYLDSITSSTLLNNPKSTYKPLKSYQFGFRPKAVEVWIVPGTYAVRRLEPKTYDSPLYKAYGGADSQNCWNWQESSTTYNTIYFQMEGLPERTMQNNNNVRELHIGGAQPCMAGNKGFGYDYGTTAHHTDVRFTGVLAGDTFTLYTYAGKIGNTITSKAQMLAMKFGVLTSTYPTNIPIFFIKAYGG